MVIFILIAVLAFVALKGMGLFGAAKVQYNANVSPTANPAAGKVGTTSNDAFQQVLGVLKAGAELADDIVVAQEAPDKYGN